MNQYRFLFLLFFLFYFSISSMGQSEGISDSLTFREKLVLLAIENNPDMEILENNQDIAKYNMQKSRWNWMSQVQVQGNVNEFTLDPAASGGTQAAFFPRYNISLTLPLGIFGTRANDVRIAKREFEITDLEMLKKQSEIRKQVLTFYENYLLFDELIRIQIQRTEDELIYYQTVEAEFKSQQATMNEFKDASNKYNRELEQQYTLLFEQKSIQLALEQLIGMSLKEAELKLSPTQ